MGFFDRLHRWLFDFSAGRREAQRVIGRLEVALAESETDRGFEECYCRLVGAPDALEAQLALAWLLRLLAEYLRPGEYLADGVHGFPTRALARRYLDDVPRRYGVVGGRPSGYVARRGGVTAALPVSVSQPVSWQCLPVSLGVRPLGIRCASAFGRRAMPVDPRIEALYPSVRAQNPLLQALVDKYRRLWWLTGVEAVTVEVNQPYDADGDALLHHVALTSGVDEVDLLVACGAEVNLKGDMGFTPLHYAAMRGRLKVVEKLLALGADAGLRNDWGDTASATAENSGHLEVARLLSRSKKNHWFP